MTQLYVQIWQYSGRVRHLDTRVEQWRTEWLTTRRGKWPSWSDLSKRIGTDGTSEQEFWRTLNRGRQRLSDEQMIESGLLIKIERKKYCHAAYIPWEIYNGTGKSKWTDDQWLILNEFIQTKASVEPYEFEKFEWDGLTLKAEYCIPFFRKGTQNFHIIGDAELSGFPQKNIKNNFFDGALSGFQQEIEDCIISGCIYTSLGIKIVSSKIGSIIHNGSTAVGEVEFIDSQIEQFSSNYKISVFKVSNSDIYEVNLRGCDVGKLSIFSNKGNEINLRMDEASFSGRFNIVGCDIVSSSNNSIEQENLENPPFGHVKFEQKLRLVDCKFKLSDFSNVQLSSQIDIEFFDKNIEDVFEGELAQIRSARKVFPRQSDRRRQRLERACQLLCERHRQDGRKDLENRFRRMEIKARSHRQGADWDTKVVSWFYSTFSDFGRSFLRPVGGIALVFFLFSMVYWAAAALVFDLNVLSGNLDRDILRQSFLLGVDKTFPFGASIDESKLFEGHLVGERAGSFGVLFGFLGALQTILSGVMVFFAGLAVRTKLLIG